PAEGDIRVRLVPVEAVDYDPYGRPSIHARTTSGGAQLMVWNEQAGPAQAHPTTLGAIVANPREGTAAGAYLRANDTPTGASNFFGRVANSAAQSSIGWAYLYTARPWSPAAEGYWYRARWYSPESARFLSRDPIGYDDGPSQYAYVGGNPINFV